MSLSKTCRGWLLMVGALVFGSVLRPLAAQAAGTSTIGGVINVTRSRPTDDFAGKVGESSGGGENLNIGAAFLLTPTDNFNALLTLEKQEAQLDNVVAPISKSGELFCIPGLLLTSAEASAQCNRNTTTDVYHTFDDAVPVPDNDGTTVVRAT